MIGYVIVFGLAACFAAPLIAVGQMYDAAKAAERAGRSSFGAVALAVPTTPVRRRPLTDKESAAARQQFADLVAAERQRSSKQRTVLRGAGYTFGAFITGTASMAWLGKPQVWHYVVSGLLAVACLAVPIFVRKVRAARG